MAAPDLPLRIGGEEVSTGDWIEVRSPQSGALLGRAARAGAPEIERAIAAADRAFRETRRMPAHRRAAILRSIEESVSAHRDEYTDMIVAEAGKPRRYAAAEVDRALITLRLAAEEASRIPGELLPVDVDPRGEGALCVVRRFAIGPVAAITPFNFPLNLVLHKVAPAIAAGAPVILKPSPRTPMTADLLARAVERSGWPAGAFSLVHADPPIARALWTDPRIRCVSFTGSDTVGWKIKEEASRRRVLLELGGNAAAIVCADADVRGAAAKLAVAAFAYAGQVCIKAQRILVAKEVERDFLDAFLEESRKMTPQDPSDPDTILGPMIDEESARRVEAWVEEARGQGALVLLEPRREGSRLSPAIVSGARRGAKIRDREIFGPVAMVDAFDDFGKALAEVNDSAYGLQAAIFTTSIGSAMAAFEELEVGGVIVNEPPTMRIDNFPYGGVKDSGFGREGVRYAIEEMTEPRTLFLKP
ncbi:MAG: aldehyde dehydrogenase family protein [Acidobacteriota bacterium]|nr:aldehyde dehydrogenase family protein [Acidobacteriota bacterium]